MMLPRTSFVDGLFILAPPMRFRMKLVGARRFKLPMTAMT